MANENSPNSSEEIVEQRGIVSNQLFKDGIPNESLGSVHIGIEIICSTINNKSPNKTAPRTSDEVVETTISLRKLNNPPKVKTINTAAPNNAVKIWNLVRSTL